MLIVSFISNFLCTHKFADHLFGYHIERQIISAMHSLSCKRPLSYFSVCIHIYGREYFCCTYITWKTWLIIGSCNDFAPVWHHAIISTNAELLSDGPSHKISEISINLNKVSFETNLEMLYAPCLTPQIVIHTLLYHPRASYTIIPTCNIALIVTDSLQDL